MTMPIASSVSRRAASRGSTSSEKIEVRRGLHLRDRVALQDVDRDTRAPRRRGAAGGFWRYSLRSVITTSASSTSRATIDRQLELADRLLEALAAHAVGQYAERRQRIGRDRQRGRLTIGRRGLDPIRRGLVVLRQIGRVDGPRALVDLDSIERPAGLLAPGALALELAGVPRPQIDDRRGLLAALHRAAIGDLPRDERPFSAAGVVGGDGEALPGKRPARRVPVARRPSAAPPTGRARPKAGSEPAAGSASPL